MEMFFEKAESGKAESEKSKAAGSGRVHEL